MYRDVTDLIPYARNARTHSDEQVAQIAASIKEFGWTNPVLTDGDSGIVAGHGRVLAARKLGLEQVPTLALDGLSKAQVRAYVLADNKLALNAGWDNELLAIELGELKTDGFDLGIIGFSTEEFDGLFAEANATPDGQTDPDDVPEEPAVPVTKTGDLWLLGRHRLLCGSSILADDVQKVLAGAEPSLMVTDPPWGVSYDPGWRNERQLAPFAGRQTSGVKNDDEADWEQAYALFPGSVAYVWHALTKSVVVAKGLTECGFTIRSQIIWVKHHYAIGRGDYHVQHEPCWYAVKAGTNGHWNGDRTQSTVWSIPTVHVNSGGDRVENERVGHGTQKPVECMRRPIVNNSNAGQAVYDPFLGSGTTIIACETTGRVCVGLDIDPVYCDVILTRWQNFTGKKATLESSGRTFEEIAKERAGESQAPDKSLKQPRYKKAATISI